MAYIPVSNTALVEIVCQLASQRVENTLYFEHAGAIVTADLDALAQAVSEWFVAEMLLYMYAGCVLQEVKATDLTTAVSPSVTYTGDAGESGTDTGVLLPNNVTYSIQFKTNGRGRSNRGRNYIFGLTDNAVATNSINTTFRANWIAGYELLLNPAFAPDWTWVVVSRYTNKAPRVAGVTEPVTAVTTADFWLDSQRRRLPGRGD